MIAAPGSRAQLPLSRERIADAACALVESVGLEQLSLREVARSLDVTAPALYAHVDGKSGLNRLVAERAFLGLSARFAEIDVADPVERIRAQCRAYLDHALSSPQLYRAMMRFAPVMPTSAEGAQNESTVPTMGPATAVFGDAYLAVEQAVERDGFDDVDPVIAALTMWSTMHGLVETLTMGLELDDATEDRLARSVVDSLMSGLFGQAPEG